MWLPLTWWSVTGSLWRHAQGWTGCCCYGNLWEGRGRKSSFPFYIRKYTNNTIKQTKRRLTALWGVWESGWPKETPPTGCSSNPWPGKQTFRTFSIFDRNLKVNFHQKSLTVEHFKVKPQHFISAASWLLSTVFYTFPLVTSHISTCLDLHLSCSGLLTSSSWTPPLSPSSPFLLFTLRDSAFLQVTFIPVLSRVNLHLSAFFSTFALLSYISQCHLQTIWPTEIPVWPLLSVCPLPWQQEPDPRCSHISTLISLI